MAELFTGNEEQLNLVRQWADEVYRDLPHLSSVPFDDRAWEPYCFETSEAIIEKARDYGFEALPRSYGSYHGHVDMGNGWGVDAMWKQFLRTQIGRALPEEVKSQFPNVVIARLEEMPELIADRYSAGNMHYWKDARTAKIFRPRFLTKK